MTKGIDEVIGNAKCFEDKLDSMNVLIMSLSIDGTSIEKAFEHCFAVLEYLGERFPEDLDDECIRRELVGTYSKLQQLPPAALAKLPIMKDTQKKEAMAHHKRIAPYLYIMPILNAISGLTGGRQHTAWEGVRGFEDDDNNLSNAFDKKDIIRAERIVSIQLMCSFIFRRMDNAERIIRRYQEFFDPHQAEQRTNAITQSFYSGLIALHCLRESKDQYWTDIALNASRAMATWAEGCKWNFENKALLLSAEYHFSIGKFDKAADEYDLSIASAHKHRFVHEEAIGNELAAYFHLDRGREDLSIELMKRAVECYQSWGAEKKAHSLLQAMQRSMVFNQV
ncbi:hypothetical protein ACHAXR_011828 [Thalassiosira sp. AJA248-18]